MGTPTTVAQAEARVRSVRVLLANAAAMRAGNVTALAAELDAAVDELYAARDAAR